MGSEMNEHEQLDEELEQDESRTQKNPKRGLLKIVLLVSLGVLMMVAAATLFQMFARPYVFRGTVLQGDGPAPSLESLTLASTGEPVDLSAYEGDVVLLYFGYVGCPDVCPTALAAISRAKDLMDPELASRVHLVMVTVDPERDADSVGDYAKAFNSDFDGAFGDIEATESVSSSYGVYYKHHEPDENGYYLVDHTASTMGIDQNGVMKIVWSSGITDVDYADDLTEMLKG